MADLARLDAALLTPARFLDECLVPAEACVLEGVTEGWDGPPKLHAPSSS